MYIVFRQHNLCLDHLSDSTAQGKPCSCLITRCKIASCESKKVYLVNYKSSAFQHRSHQMPSLERDVNCRETQLFFHLSTCCLLEECSNHYSSKHKYCKGYFLALSTQVHLRRSTAVPDCVKRLKINRERRDKRRNKGVPVTRKKNRDGKGRENKTEK